MDNSTKLMNVQETANYFASLGAPVTIWFVRGLILKGQIDCLKLGRRYFVSADAIHEYLATHEKRLRK